MVEEQCQQQPHQGLIEDFIEMSEALSESSDTCVVVFPREKEEEITALLAEEGSGKEEGEEPQKLILHLNPIYLDPSATAQPQNSPLPLPAANSNLQHLLPKLSPTHHCLPCKTSRD